MCIKYGTTTNPNLPDHRAWEIYLDECFPKTTTFQNHAKKIWQSTVPSSCELGTSVPKQLPDFFIETLSRFSLKRTKVSKLKNSAKWYINQLKQEEILLNVIYLISLVKCIKWHIKAQNKSATWKVSNSQECMTVNYLMLEH